MILLDDVARRDRTKPGEDEVTKDFEVIERAGNGQLNGVTMDLSSFSTTRQAIFAEGADYTKKSVESRLAVVEKLLGCKSLEAVIQIQSEYAKTAYAAFVAQATKMGELHSNLAKAAFKPAELAIANMQGTK
jgi:hypothetical protein